MWQLHVGKRTYEDWGHSGTVCLPIYLLAGPRLWLQALMWMPQ
jgi:hypothetical protein